MQYIFSTMNFVLKISLARTIGPYIAVVINDSNILYILVEIDPD